MSYGIPGIISKKIYFTGGGDAPLEIDGIEGPHDTSLLPFLLPLSPLNLDSVFPTPGDLLVAGDNVLKSALRHHWLLARRPTPWSWIISILGLHVRCGGPCRRLWRQHGLSESDK